MNTQSFSNEIDINFSFEKYWSVLKRRWLPAVAVFGGCMALTAFAISSIDPAYRASSKILVESDKTSSLTDVGQTGLDNIADLRALGRLSDPIVTAVESIRSVPIAISTIEALGLKDPETGEVLNPARLLSDLTVAPIPGTDMIRLSYEAASSEEASVVVNTLMDVYMQRNIQENYSKAFEAREFLAQQLPLKLSAVEEAEASLRSFQEQNRVVSLDQEAGEMIQSLARLDDTIATVRSQLATTEAQAIELQQQLGMSPQQALRAAALSQSQPVQNAYSQLQTIEGQLDLERARYRDSHPIVLELERQHTELSQRLQERVGQVVDNSNTVVAKELQIGALQQQLTGNLVQTEVERIGLLQQLEALSSERRYQQERANLFPSLGQSQRSLERDLRTAQNTYEALVQRLQEIDIAAGQPVSNVSIVSAALPPENPVPSSKKLVLAGGFLIGTLMALMTAFLIDLVDRRTISPKSVQSFFRAPLLGNIPSFSRLNKRNAANLLTPGGHPQSDLAKRVYYALQANLGHVLPGHRSNVVALTSAITNEGKSTITANLGMAIAQSGQRVLIIDADFQNPSQHIFWNCSNQKGLYQVVNGGSKIDEVVQSVAQSLWILTSGNLEGRGLAMLTLHDLEAFLDKVRETYDIVLIDTPALDLSLDASSIGKMVDGTILVIRPEVMALMSDLRATRDMLQESGQRVLGIVMNGSKESTAASYDLRYVDEAQLDVVDTYRYSAESTKASNGNGLVHHDNNHKGAVAVESISDKSNS